MKTPPTPSTQKRNLLQQLSWRTLVTNIHACATRFPLTVMYVLLLSLWSMADALDIIPAVFKPAGILEFIFSAGILLTLVIYLWTEEQDKPRRSAWLKIVANAILVCDTVWLYAEYYHGLSWAIEIGHAAAIGALMTGVFFVSFIGEKDDAASWNFSWSLIKSYMITGAIALIMALAIALITMTADSLFHLQDIWRYQSCLMILGCLTIPSLIFLGRIPAGKAKHNRNAQPSRFLTGVTRYLFVPTMALLLAILYIYALTILINFELPNGTVSWSVTGAIAGCCLIEFLLYPSRISGTSARDAAITRWMPIVILPLLVLMTIAIVRRISDYGITVERLYVLTFNIWAYGVCISLFLTRARRLYWIPCSFTGLFLITSILPVNYVTISRSIIQHDLRTKLEAITDQPLPLSQIDYNKLIDMQKLRTKDMLEGKLHYLQNNFGEESLAGIVSVDKNRQRYWYAQPHLYDDSTRNSNIAEIDLKTIQNAVEIPDGYRTVKDCDYISQFKKVSNHPLIIEVIDNKVTVGDVSGNPIRFTVNVDSLKTIRHMGALDRPITCPVEGSDSTLFTITKAHIYFTQSKPEEISYVSINGYLFSK